MQTTLKNLVSTEQEANAVQDSLCLIDSHCHLNSSQLREDAEAHITRANENGVKKFVIVGSELDDSREAVEMAHRFAANDAWATVGIHPHEVERYFSGNNESSEIDLSLIPPELVKLALDSRVIAVGEIGLDYYYDNSPRDIQRFAFRCQLEWAATIHKPVILHIRDAMPDAMSILTSFTARHENIPLLFHCYSGGLEYLDAVLDLGGLYALGGAVTWKKSDELREVARRIPADRLLLETDCPYMAPAPFRGRTNTPALVRRVYETVADVRGVTLEELAAQVADNAKKFFGWRE